MFLGEHVHTIDEKNRLAIPARFRQELADGLYLTKGVDRCLYALTPDGWSRLADRIAALPSMQASVRQLQRHFFAGAVHLVPDRLGRIVIPQNLRDYAQLQGDVVVAGVHSRIELWNRPAWSQERARVDDETASLAEQMASLGI
ncbi:MAG TPA: division/cell wall cluster transcriptional repressor MraZ [Chloroflexota bacterium]|nr:division/cell wall cluster transcriptional repressor MraZ [Chloroflexota bacterium]